MIAVLFLCFMIQEAPDWFQLWPDPATLSAVRTTSPMRIDGQLDEEVWEHAHWSDPFVDITGRSELNPIYETRTALVWNDSALYIGARLEEPHVWGTLTQRDTVIYYDNDFEFFFDPDGDNHGYGELEINALNTVWDLMLRKPYRDGGPAVTAWNMEGLQHAVWIDGSLNDPSDTDRGWTLELCIPWKDIRDLTDSPLPPFAGSIWRINFSRVQWSLKDSGGTYIKRPGRENNWVWSPIGIVNMHIPERWGRLVFTEGRDVSHRDLERLAGEESARRTVMEGYYAQKKFRKTRGKWASTIEELNSVLVRPLAGDISLRTTSSGYEIRSSYDDGQGTSRLLGTSEDGKVFREEGVSKN